MSEIYRIANTASKISQTETPKADEFSNNITLDNNGNVMVELKTAHGEKHTLSLSNPHKSSRGHTENMMLNQLKVKLQDICDKILENISGNIKDQCSEEANYYTWSAFDLADQTPLQDRLTKMKPLIEKLTSNTPHEVKRYTNKTET